MGNLNCKSCNCAQFFEKKVELDLKNPIPVHLDQNSSNKAQKVPSVKINYDKLKPYIHKLEALWLGYTARNFVIHLRRQTKSNHEYFSRAEIHETLSKKVGMAEFRQKKQAFKYSSGAVYTGQWLGGFRDGFGTMEWPNGAKYQGNWSYSKPCGFGSFTHVDGDVYEGEWKICFVSPKDTFGTGSNLERWKDMVSDGYCNFYLVWLWIKQEIFRTEAPKKFKGVEVAKSMNFNKKTIQIDEEVGIRSSVMIQQSSFGKVSQAKHSKPSSKKFESKKRSSSESDDSSEKSENKNRKKTEPRQPSIKSPNYKLESKPKPSQNSETKSSLKLESKPKPETKLDPFPKPHAKTEKDPHPKHSETSLKTPDFDNKFEFSITKHPPESKTEEDHESIKTLATEKPVAQSTPSQKFSQKSSPKFSLAQKSIIVTADKPKPTEKPEPYQSKRSGPPVIRYKKQAGNSKNSENFISEFDYNGDESFNSSRQDFPSVSINESKRSSFSKTNKSKHETINEKSSESSSSKSKTSSYDPVSMIKTRITLSENSLLELKKAISDILVPKNQGSGHSFSQKKYKNGNLYVGELKGDAKDGRGKLVFTGGDIYEGEWKDDKQHGKGKMTWSNGAMYVGYFEQDMKSGIGEYVWSDGASYMGEWRENLFHGYGRYRWMDGRIYNGQWESGLRQGFGIIVDKNGNKYEGEFQSDKMHGSGTLTKSSGEVIKGTWALGKLS